MCILIIYNEQDFMYVFECTQEQKRQKLLIWIDKKMSMFHHNLFIHMCACMRADHWKTSTSKLLYSKHILITHAAEKERLHVNKISLFGNVLCNIKPYRRAEYQQKA